jgi:hypothetical protein
VKNLTPEQLNELAYERLTDAKVLEAAGRLECALYICGYALEMKLKYRMCKTLDWDEYPGDGKDKNRSFKTHKLEDLLHLSGVEKRINAKFIAEKSIVVKWDPEIRYSSEKQTPEDVELMIKATETLLSNL